MKQKHLCLKLGITQESLEKLIEFMPEIKEFDDISKVESFIKKYTGKNNFENHTISVETFIKEFNKKHPECKLEPQYCEACLDKEKNIADVICQCCKKNIYHEHSDVCDNKLLKICNFFEFPAICKTCKNKIHN